jgi:amino acid permease
MTPSPLGSVVNLLNGTLGAGILAMPLMYSLLGWFLGTLVLAVVAGLGVVTTTLMAYVASHEHVGSFHLAVKQTIGISAFYVFQVLLIFGALGTMLACFILVGDFAEAVGTQLANTRVRRNMVVLLLSIFVLLPLCLMRKLKSLWFTGSMALALAAFYVLAMVYEAIHPSQDFPPVHTQAVDVSLGSFFMGVPLAMFAYSSHAVVFPIYTEMRQPCVHGFARIAARSYAVLFVAYSASG